jgi:hypothetical protein
MGTYTEGTGYPDWTRVDTLVSDPLVYEESLTLAESKTFGPFYVAPFPTTLISMGTYTTTGYGTVQMTWYATSTAKDLISAFTWHFGDHNSLIDGIVNNGPWLKVTAELFSGIITSVPRFTITATTSTPTNCRVSLTKLLAGTAADSIPGKGSSRIRLDPVTTGPAFLCVNSTATAWGAYVQSFYEGALGPYVAYANNATAGNSPVIPFYLPQYPMVLTIQNGTEDARTFNYAVTVP